MTNALKKFVTKVEIAITHAGEHAEHVLQVKAANLASSAESLKEGLNGLVAALCLPKPDHTNALEKLFAALALDVKDPKVYELAVKKAKAEYDALVAETKQVEQKVATALENGIRILHESECLKPPAAPEVTPDMHDEITTATVEGTDLVVDMTKK